MDGRLSMFHVFSGAVAMVKLLLIAAFLLVPCGQSPTASVESVGVDTVNSRFSHASGEAEVEFVSYSLTTLKKHPAIKIKLKNIGTAPAVHAICQVEALNLAGYVIGYTIMGNDDEVPLAPDSVLVRTAPFGDLSSFRDVKGLRFKVSCSDRKL